MKSIARLLSLCWHALNATRRLVSNLLFLVLVAAVLVVVYEARPVRLDERTVLVLNLHGNLVEQHAPRVGTLAWSGLMKKPSGGDVQLRDVVRALDTAAGDPKISAVLLLEDDLGSSGLAIEHEITAAMDRFKKTGKPIIAWGSGFEQRQYLLAAHASEIYLDPMGQIFLEGFGQYRNYFRDALDKLGITVHLMRVGTYKSFAEPYIANGPSPAAQEADKTLYDALWKDYMDDVEAARHLPAGSLQATIDSLPQRLDAAGGDPAKLALSLKWVDGLKTRDDIRHLMIKKGELDSASQGFRQISLEDYLDRQHQQDAGPAIAVVVAEGDIQDSEAGAGTISGITTAKLIRKAREDNQVKAVVFRVDSPGGSAFASEEIRRELVLTRAKGKPVVVSMGNLAASGGYWITMGANDVIADPDTVTGSIGVFALFPTAEKLMDRLGIHSGGITTTWLSDARNPLKPMDPRFQSLVQTDVNHIYHEFVTRAAAARKTSPAKIDNVAQGRVWTGKQAETRGLVDHLGQFHDAIRSAVRLAHLEGVYHLEYFDPEPPGWEYWLDWFDNSLLHAIGPSLSPWWPIGQWFGLTSPAPATYSWLQRGEGHAPFVVTAHCLCVSP